MNSQSGDEYKDISDNSDPHAKELIIAKFNNLGETTKSFIHKNRLGSDDIEYLIHDNGGTPFKVIANDKLICVYTFKDDADVEFDAELVYDVHLLTINEFIGYWVGFDTSKYTNFHGNSVLIQETEHSYVSIGWIIHRFQTSDQILDYVSPVGNSDVPYPVAYGELNVYFMLEMQYVPREQLITDISPVNAETIYGEYYRSHDDKLRKTNIKEMEVLVKRKW
jgi:hypothetical protein